MLKLNINTTYGTLAAVLAGFVILMACSAARMQPQVAHESTVAAVSIPSAVLPVQKNNYPIVVPVQNVDSEVPEYGTYGRPVDIPGVTPTQDDAADTTSEYDQTSQPNDQYYETPGSEEQENYAQPATEEQSEDPQQSETSDSGQIEVADNSGDQYQ